MQKRIRKILALTKWSFCIILLVGIMLVGDASADGFAIVVNRSNEIDNISSNDLVKYFSAKKKFWPNGKKVVILLREAGSEEKEVLSKKVYKLSENRLKKMWVGKVYKGEISSPPKVVSSSSAMIKSVMNKEGGIGIVKAKDISDGVKVLRIDGKLPSDAGYPLVK
jgi:hypothetical protein